MKVLLINPDQPEYIRPKEYYIPASLMCLGSMLRQNGIDAKMLDLNVIKYKRKTNTSDAIIKKIEEYKPNLIGLTIMGAPVFTTTLLYSNIIKNKFPDIKIIIGGMHSTLFHKEILEHCDSIDYAADGPGEIAIVKLVKYLLGEISIESVPSIAYKLNGKVNVNKREEIIDLSLLPKLDYDLVEDINDFYHEGLSTQWHNPKKHNIRTSLATYATRGCPVCCNFCAMYKMMGKKWNNRPYMDVVDEIEMLYNKYGDSHFSFLDDSLTLNRTNIISICNEIIKRGLDLQLATPNGVYINSLNKEVLDAMYEAGFIRIMLAIESGNEWMRNKIMHKNLKNEKIYEIIALAKSYKNLQIGACFVIGMPEETNETLQDTYDMVVNIDVDYPAVHNIVPYPGTELFNQCYTDNLFIKDIDVNNLWNMDIFYIMDNKQFFIKPYNLSIEELNTFRKKIDDVVNIYAVNDFKIRER